MLGIVGLQLSKAALVLAVAYATGRLVRDRGFHVGYARKLNHFVLFLTPLALDRMFVLGKSTGAFLGSAFASLLLLAIFIAPLRRRFAWIDTSFASFDRPEDRPYTLRWLVTQVLAGYVVIAPAILLFRELDLTGLLFIPLLINGIGDGLAEPVGVRWGRHRYRVKGLNGRVYQRSLEGSAAVFLTSVVVILAHASAFSPVELGLALAIVPIAMTLTEAFSPHTWDTPFLFLVGYGSLALICAW